MQRYARAEMCEKMCAGPAKWYLHMTGLAGVRVWPRVYRPFLCKHLKNEMKVKCENKVACAPFA